MNAGRMVRWLALVAGLAMAFMLAACTDGAGLDGRSGSEAAGLAGAAPARPSAPVQGESPAPADPAPRLLTYTATIDLRVAAVPAGVAEVEAIADRYGGYVANSRVFGGPEAPRASVTIRVPSQFFRNAMNDLRGAGDRVLSESLSTEDVTDQYTDLEAQLRSLRAAEAQYLELLRRAQTVEDTLRVQTQLRQVRTDIERIQGRLLGLDRRIEYSTITANLSQPGVTLGRDGFDPGRIIREAWEGSLVFLQTVAEVVLRVAVFFWWFCIPAVLIGLVAGVLVARRRRPKPPAAI